MSRRRLSATLSLAAVGAVAIATLAVGALAAEWSGARGSAAKAAAVRTPEARPAGAGRWNARPAGAGERIVRPYESASGFVSTTAVDAPVLTALQTRGIESANACSDEVFFRRVYLDLIGTLPEPAQLRKFLSDTRGDKRAALIDELLEREEYADYWAVKWCDILRVKAEFPVNLWPNAVQAYHRWIRDSLRENKPYDQFARELLTSSGSNFRVAPVNFYRAIQGRDAPTIAAAVALTFMGSRLEKWPEAQRAGMAAFFTRIAYKYTAEWKEEIVCLNPASTTTLEAVFPDGRAVKIPAGVDPRQVFADWLIAADNPWFARAIVNRVWCWLVGRGVIHEPDDIRPDFVQPGNPPSNPELLAVLEKEFVKANYDLKALYRLILNSRTYQQSSIPRGDALDEAKAAEREALFAHYIARRLDAEVLIDALDWIGGTAQKYESPIPEPFTYIPQDLRTIQLADGSITSTFLETFGRPSRDTGLESERNNAPSDKQRLHMLNSTDVQRKLESSPWLTKIMSESAKQQSDPARAMIRGVYQLLLTRDPTPDELAAAGDYMRSVFGAAMGGGSGGSKNKQSFGQGRFAAAKNGKGFSGQPGRQAMYDLAWALINTKEFLYRH